MTLKKKTAGSVVLTVFIIVLALVLIAAAVCFFVVKHRMDSMELRLDDASQYASGDAMSIFDRVSIEKDLSVKLNIDKRDIWSTVIKKLGSDWEDRLSDKFAEKGLTYRGIGVHLSPYLGAFIDVEAAWHGLRIAGRVFYEVKTEDESIVFAPSRVLLGGWELSPEQLADFFSISVDDYSIVIPVNYDIVDLKSITFGDETLTVTCKVKLGGILGGIFKPGT